jgi:serine/threonine protein kinase
MLSPGTILDNKYRVEAVIGRGGFGHVYRARERLTGETVAIKELLPSLVHDRDVAQRFLQEARATLRLTHPHIARTYGVFHDQNTYYLAMEYLPGGSLAARLEEAPLGLRDALATARDLCQALAYAHQEGVIHCDIKPANVLFDRRGRAHLADFGIAYVSAEMMTRRFYTVSGVALGTVRYMAPEQLEGVRNDARVDVYAMGALLYEMLAGRPYLDFEEETTPAAQMRNMQRIQTSSPVPLRAVNPAVPEYVAQVVGQALQKSPAARFSTAGRLEEALRAPAAPAATASDRHEVRRIVTPTEAVDQAEASARASHRGPSVPVAGDEPSTQPSRRAQPVVPSSEEPAPPAVPARKVLKWPTIDMGIIRRLWGELVEYWGLVPTWARALVAFALVTVIVAGAGIVMTLAGVVPAQTEGSLPVFVSNRDGEREIYRLGADGGAVRVTHTSRGESWSPTIGPGGALYFTSDRDGRREIYRLEADGDTVRVTRTSPGESWSPALGPRGTLYFTSNRDGPREIYRLDADGSTIRVTRTSQGESWSPALAPNGTLYFTSNRDGPREIYRLDADAGAVRVTHTGRGESWSPALGPRGTLYFTSERDGRREVYRLENDGSAVRVTHTSAGESWSPWVGPSGILYITSSRDGKPEIYRLESDAAVVRVTHTSGGGGSWLSSPE